MYYGSKGDGGGSSGPKTSGQPKDNQNSVELVIEVAMKAQAPTAVPTLSRSGRSARLVLRLILLSLFHSGTERDGPGSCCRLV